MIDQRKLAELKRQRGYFAGIGAVTRAEDLDKQIADYVEKARKRDAKGTDIDPETFTDDDVTPPEVANPPEHKDGFGVGAPVVTDPPQVETAENKATAKRRRS